MKMIVLNNINSLVQHGSDSVTLRLAYLLSTNAVMAGDSSTYYMYYESLFQIKSLEMRAHFLAQNYRDVDPKFSQEMLNSLGTIKASNKIKHRTPAQIVAIKRMEKTLNDLFEQEVNNHLVKLKEFGLIQLRPLADKGQFYNLPTVTNKYEGNEKGSIHGMNLSEILKYTIEEPDKELDGIKHKNHLDKEDDFHLFCLTPEFYDFNLWKGNLPVNATHPSAANKNAFVMEHFISLPNINALTAIELEALHDATKGMLESWYTAIDNCVKKCKLNSDDSLDYLKESVMPLSKNIHEAFAQNDIIKQIAYVLKQEVAMEVHLGLIPVQELIRCFLENKIIHEESAGIINEYLKEEGKLDYRVPIIAIKTPETNTAQKQPREETISSVKKSLNID